MRDQFILTAIITFSFLSSNVLASQNASKLDCIYKLKERSPKICGGNATTALSMKPQTALYDVKGFLEERYFALISERDNAYGFYIYDESTTYWVPLPSLKQVKAAGYAEDKPGWYLGEDIERMYETSLYRSVYQKVKLPYKDTTMLLSYSIVYKVRRNIAKLDNNTKDFASDNPYVELQSFSVFKPDTKMFVQRRNVIVTNDEKGETAYQAALSLHLKNILLQTEEVIKGREGDKETCQSSTTQKKNFGTYVFNALRVCQGSAKSKTKGDMANEINEIKLLLGI